MTNIDWERPIESQTGDPALFLYKLKNNAYYKYVVVVAYKDGDKLFFLKSCGEASDGTYPIRNVAQKFKRVVVLYRVEEDVLSEVFDCIEEFKNSLLSDADVVAIQEVEITEGDGVEFIQK